MSGRRVAQWTLLFLALMSTWRLGMAYNKTCGLPKSAGSQTIPSVSQQFTVHVEATFVDKNSTIEFVEYFDYNNNRGRLRQTKHGAVTDYFYDYNTNELLVVSPDSYSCQVQKLSSAGYTFVLGDQNGHVFSPAAALRLAGQTGAPAVYIGKGTVRGIQVNQWALCQDWPQSNTFMQVTWSFVDNLAWVASASIVDVPVLCHVIGRVYSEDQQSYRSFEHFYEFVHFVDNIPPPSQHVFETPSGIVCPGRRNTKPLPTLPDVMAFTGESVNEERKSITYTEEKYDSRGRIVIYKYRGFTVFSARFGSNPMAVVNDFNTGSEYVVDLQRGNCTISPLTSTPDVSHASDLVTLRLKSAMDILDLNGNYTYQGQRTIRGTPCDVWIIQKHEMDLMGITVNATFEWAFSMTGWTYQNEPVVSAVPVQAIYTLDDFGSRQQAVTNVYDYTASVPDIFEGINLDSCFIGLPRNSIVFSISRVYKTLLQYFQSQFKYAVRHSISQAINVSPLRVANVQYTVQQFSLDVRLDLLSVPPVHSKVVDPATELPLDQATQALVDAVQGNRLVIELRLDSGKPSFIVADPRSLRVNKLNQVKVVTGAGAAPAPAPRATAIFVRPTAGTDVDPAPPPVANVSGPNHGLCQQYVTDDSGYSVGVMVGSALAMGVVGGVLGGLTHRLMIRQVS